MTTHSENDLAKLTVDCAFKVHTKLGPGLLESVYETVLAYELERRGVIVTRQKPIGIRYDDITFNEGFRADIIVSDKLILELKSVENILPVHRKQLTTYLRLTGLKLGLLINFNSALIKDGINRVANGIED